MTHLPKSRHQTLWLAALIWIITGWISAPVETLAQAGTDSDPTRQFAFQLFEQGKLSEALPVLEKLALSYPSDPAVLSRLGFALFASTSTITDVAEREKVRSRVRDILLRSRKAGDDSALTMVTLEGVSTVDTKEVPFSSNHEADKAIREGEQAYVSGDLDRALAAYKRAVDHDPKSYYAALFAGHMYFKKKEWDGAGEWFARAIAIDPDRETAHRYWGNALMMGQGKRVESRDKFIEAIIAEPYSRRSWVGLMQWGKTYNVDLTHPLIEPPVATTPLQGGKMTITLPEKSNEADGTFAWTTYGLARASWASSKFAKEFPSEKSYRHSLREEADAFRLVVETLKKRQSENKVTRVDPMLARLAKLYDEGLLEAFILFARADQGIAQDFAGASSYPEWVAPGDAVYPLLYDGRELRLSASS